MSFEPDLAEAKATLRKEIRAKRREIGEAERRLAADVVAAKLQRLEKLIGAHTVLSYMPMRYELDIAPASAMLKEAGVRIAYPLCIEEGGLRLFIPAEEDGFKIGAYGILEPDTETALEIGAEELDAIILPAIGFDYKGRRLGQGGGYYDRLLARTDCFTVAVGFDCQLVPSVPVEPTDKTVDIVVTPGFTIVP
ncbi:MAG: 5-formyltetrahydrofolate cyclo-ligase [Clostridia bacterium]|nr:5-formyltetrahydrofolate cyclo-ligase [Clostridia bacterium]